MRIVYIAEKPDIAASMAEYLWKDSAKRYKLSTHYIDADSSSGNETVVTWAYGHILMQAMPEEYGDRFKDFSSYPVIPEEWKKIPSPSAKEQLKAIQMLLKKADVVVNGGDPDREGQLLVDEILEYCGYKGEVRRILINAKDNESLKRAFSSIQPNENFRSLYMAGLARERADWLVGMNLSRAYSVNAQKQGLRNTWRIGRVKMPTLSLVVAREREIENFKPVKYYVLTGKFVKDGVPFEANLVTPEDAPSDSENRITSLDYIKKVKSEVENKTSSVSKCERKSGVERPPLPYSLDTLQADTNRRFGVSPGTTLSIVQGLYEKKFVSYPRSDCNYIPDSQHGDARRIINGVYGADSSLASGADVNIKGKAFDSSKVSAHHAIIPTGVKPSGLSDLEQKIYDTIALRYLIQFYPPCRYSTVTYEMECNGYKFSGSGKVVTDKGWKAVSSSSEEKEDNQSILPAIEKGMSWSDGVYTIADKVTSPPKRFTEGSLLTAMTNIWKYVSQDNPNRERLKECKGLGTPATRATIISELMEQKGTVKPCIGKDGKDLYPTPFGCFLIDNIDESLTKPDFTAEMEYNLSQIAVGKKSLEEYMSETERLVSRNISFAESSDFQGCQSLRENEQKPLVCPVCGKLSVVRRLSKKTKKYFWVCSDQECKHPVTKETVFYDDSSHKPLIGLCPDCGTVMSHVFSQKTRKYYWRCPKCDAFKDDAKKFKG